MLITPLLPDLIQRAIWKEAHRILQEYGGKWRSHKRFMEQVRETNAIIERSRSPTLIQDKYKYC